MTSSSNSFDKNFDELESFRGDVQLLSKFLDIIADKAVLDVHVGSVIEEIERALYCSYKYIFSSNCNAVSLSNGSPNCSVRIS